MIKIAGIKEVPLAHASPGHLLLYRQLGEKLGILVHRPQQEAHPAIGLIALSQSPMVRWLQPEALDASCVDFGSFELVFSSKFESVSSAPENFAPGALIVEADGPALICSDPNGMEVRFGISDWRLRTNPIHGTNFYILEWELGIAAIDNNFDGVYTQKRQGP